MTSFWVSLLDFRRILAMFEGFVLSLIRFYQRFISPLFGNVCRFEPSCSHYAAACIRSYGLGRGGALAALRLCKCHPFHPGGFDPPPFPPFAVNSGAKWHL